MTEHAIGTREEWLAARLELLDAEKELTRRSDELARRRQELPWVRIEKEYRFETDEGPATLADLFQGRSQLLVYQFMFGPDYTAGCPSCSAIADGFNGSVLHLANHDVTLGAVSRAPPNPGIDLCSFRGALSSRFVRTGIGAIRRQVRRLPPVSRRYRTAPRSRPVRLA